MASTSVWPTTAPSSDIRSIEFDCPEVATEGDFTDTRGTCKLKDMNNIILKQFKILISYNLVLLKAFSNVSPYDSFVIPKE